MFFVNIVGLTGGIATGKTTVSSLFSQLNAAIVDSDEIAKSIVKPGKPAFKRIVATFGEQVLDEEGNLDRQKLGSIIFKDPSARRKLNSITHPKVIFEMIKQTILHWVCLRLVVVWNTPLLIETNLHKLCKSVVVVFAEPEVQLDRLIKRDGLEKDAALDRIYAQMSIHDKCRLADHVVNNNGDLNSTCSQISSVYKKISPSHPLLVRFTRIGLMGFLLWLVYFTSLVVVRMIV
ncbi:hypothetical protein P9112_000715 [Eukaryota sp. TZLM1-RC]